MDIDIRNKIVQSAIADLGNTDPQKYWESVLQQEFVGPFPKHWCGSFALAHIKKYVETPILWEVGKGFCYQLKTTKSPLPGDVAYFTKGQHHALVERIIGNLVVTIDGNSWGESTGKINGVNRLSRTINSVAAFYSIESL